MNFWKKILQEKGMILGLAPMDGVTDAAFRWMVAKYGKPDVMYTEFVNVEGLMRGRVEKLLPILIYDEIERPIVAQLFGKTPEDFYRATVLVCELGFDGVDINMGCPVKRVAEKGAGAGLIKTPKLAQEIVRQVKLAVEDWSGGRVGLEEVAPSKEWVEIIEKFSMRTADRRRNTSLTSSKKRSTFVRIPVSVKTRLGVKEDVSEWWMGVLGEVKPAAIALHGRTLKQMYSGQADWEAIGRAGEIVKKKGIVFLGNGDVTVVRRERGEVKRNGLVAEEVVRKYGVDGVLIGRASFGRPDLFSNKPQALRAGSLRELRTYTWMVEHARKYEEISNLLSVISDQDRRFLPMRKHLAWYARGFEGAKELRSKLVQCESAEEVERLIADQ